MRWHIDGQNISYIPSETVGISLSKQHSLIKLKSATVSSYYMQSSRRSDARHSTY